MGEFAGPDFEQLRKSIHIALRNWGHPDADGLEVLDRLQFVRSLTEQSPSAPGRGSFPPAYQLLMSSVAELGQRQELLADLLRCRFIERETILFAAHRFHLSEDQINRRQREAIEQLARLVLSRETAFRRERAEMLLAALPPGGDSPILGVAPALQALLEALRSPGGPWLLALVGLGGLGKTALAQAALRRLIPEFRFEDVIWLRGPFREEGKTPMRARDQLLGGLSAQIAEARPSSGRDYTTLQRALKARACLIVVDDAGYLLKDKDSVALLHNLANPGKFLLTSRLLPIGEHAIPHLPIPELDQENTARLLEQLAEAQGQPQAIPHLLDHIEDIYGLVGGHPRALRLLAGRLKALPLSAVLDGFAQGTDESVSRMYRHVYRPTLEVLSDPARRLLQHALPTGADSFSYEQLQAAGVFDERDLRAAISELVAHCLLQMTGSVLSPSYRIHRLTATFLQSRAMRTNDNPPK